MGTLIISVKSSIIETLAVQSIQFFSAIVLARIIEPYDYGIYALFISITVATQSLIESGLSSAIIAFRINEENVLNTIFTGNILTAILISIVLVGLCIVPLPVFHFAGLKLTLLFSIPALLLYSLGVVPKALLLKKLDFVTLAKITIISVLISSLISICLSFFGYGLIGLISGFLVRLVIELILIYFTVDKIWSPTLHFKYKIVLPYIKFGNRLYLAGLINSLFDSLLASIIGRNYSMTSLGYLNRSDYFVSATSKNLGGLIGRVFFPYISLKAEKNAELNFQFSEQLRIFSFLSLLVSVILIFYRKILVVIILGRSWDEVAVILLYTSIIGYCLPILSLLGTYLKAIRKSTLTLVLQIVNKVILIPVLYFGIIKYEEFNEFYLFYILFYLIAFCVTYFIILIRIRLATALNVRIFFNKILILVLCFVISFAVQEMDEMAHLIFYIDSLLGLIVVTSILLIFKKETNSCILMFFKLFRNSN